MVKIKNVYVNDYDIKEKSKYCVEINEGEFVAVIGPSATEKSAFLRCINRIDQQPSGEVWVNDINIMDKSVSISDVRLMMGLVYQSPDLFSHLTVQENILSGPLKLCGMLREEAYEHGRYLLKLMNIESKENCYPDELTADEKQMATIARAIAVRPQVMCFDDPTCDLNTYEADAVLRVIHGIKKKGYTIIMATDNLSFVRKEATKILYFDDGMIYEHGTPEEIYKNPQKEKTRQFMLQQSVINFTLVSANVNYNQIMQRIDRFEHKNQIPVHMTNLLKLLIEELCLVNLVAICPKEENIFIYASYFAEGEEMTVHIEYRGQQRNVEENPIDELSIKKVEQISKHFNYEYSNGYNRYQIILG